METSNKLIGQTLSAQTSSPADTHANHSAQLANAKEQTTQDIYGRTSGTPFAHFDHELHCWKTLQGTFPLDSATSNPTWPRSGMTRNGIAYQLQPLAPRTCETEFSSLLWTPTRTANYAAPSMKARNGNDGYSNPEWVEWLMGFPIGWTDCED
jgi:hypothetical protein